MKDLEYFYDHLEKVLLKTGFIYKNNSGKIMKKLRCLYTRALISQNELNILHGILSSFEKHKKTK